MKPLSGILLVVGTAIGGGMLALPMITAPAGYLYSLAVFIAVWGLMTLGAFYLLEVNLTLPDGSHLISMSRTTMGWVGAVAVGFFYVVLLYSAIAAYIASGGDLLNFLLKSLHASFPLWLSSLLFTILFSLIIYSGIKKIDWANRLFMLLKFALFMILVLVIMPHAQPARWRLGHASAAWSSLSVIAAAFTFGMIIPSLRHFYQGNLTVLRKVILLGSLVPLMAYLLWDAVVQGTVPAVGAHGLSQMMHSAHAVSELAIALGSQIHSSYIGIGTELFSSVCVLTSFLGIGLSLVSFFQDGIKDRGWRYYKVMLFAIAFLPPWLVTVVWPQAFVYGLRLAGICAVLLMMLSPSLMAFRSRYVLKTTASYRVFGGKPLLLAHLLCAILLSAYVVLHF